MESIFDKVKEKVTIKEVVERIGNLHLDRNGKALCPFHREKTPSFSIKKNENIFKCFGCGERGDAIHFVAKLKEIEPIEAVRLINEVFNLGLFSEKPRYIGKSVVERKVEQERKALETYRKWLDTLYDSLCYIYRTLTDWKRDYAPKTQYDAIDKKWLFAIDNIDLIEFMADQMIDKSHNEISPQGLINDRELTIMTNRLKEELNGRKLRKSS